MKVYLKIREGKLSKKSIEKGKVKMNSLFLMFHDSLTQKRSYEFLKLYIYDKPKTIIEKDHNRETLQLAESIKAQKVLEFNSKKHGFVSSMSGKIGFLNYFNELVEKRYDTEGTYGNWYSTLKHLTIFCKGIDIQISKVDETFLENFKEYLLKEKISNKGGRLSQNTALSYFNKVRTALKEAHRNKMISENPILRVKTIKEKETNREYLTLEELQNLVKTECELPIMKDAFIFSCLTGVRFCDVENMKWKDLFYDSENGWMLKYIQQKTKGVENLPINEQAVKLLGEKKADDFPLFENLEYSAYNNKKLHKWVKEAGIDKHITYHSSRHTFATLQLTMGTDIYTVSKLLGHRHVKTTEIYGKVIDKKKIDAVSKIPDLYL
ncbi:tyrosine-type recombinase/integrase [Chryseobacterium indologenes]|uniref:tyrosine-type recombinase/integrase n=1 Tax=Chryseobacterium indologenes TaxID=253 RepID=UPI0018937086|nr:site-specific integrase [Chryseobacterium indologenes]MBF6643574.1 site-specific integrase [Chryseobacterium indologenes]